MSGGGGGGSLEESVMGVPDTMGLWMPVAFGSVGERVVDRGVEPEVEVGWARLGLGGRG